MPANGNSDEINIDENRCVSIYHLELEMVLIPRNKLFVPRISFACQKDTPDLIVDELLSFMHHS